LGGTGLEHRSKTPAKSHIPKPTGVNSGVSAAYLPGVSTPETKSNRPIDNRLCRIVQMWSELPEDERQALYRLLLTRAAAVLTVQGKGGEQYHVNPITGAVWESLKLTLSSDNTSARELEGFEEMLAEELARTKTEAK
jgi:hypothetical protein